MARMHEILGVEPGEVFEFEARGERVKFRIDAAGNLFRETMDHRRIPSPREVVEIINNTDRIIRKPRLTEKQKTELKHLAALGLKYLTTNWEGWLYARDVKPTKTSGFVFTKQFVTHRSCAGSLADLVSCDDPEPLDIIQTLKDNNKERTNETR